MNVRMAEGTVVTQNRRTEGDTDKQHASISPTEEMEEGGDRKEAVGQR